MIAKVGEARKVSFRKELMIIQEIIDSPDISMEWTWAQGICPHCQKKIEKTILHKFIRIEILAKMGVEPEHAKLEDIFVSGFSEDRKNLVLTLDKAKEAFSKSEKFKHLAEV